VLFCFVSFRFVSFCFLSCRWVHIYISSSIILILSFLQYYRFLQISEFIRQRFHSLLICIHL
jgi:hypothetical protein